jgi:hypothetical protein
MNVQKLRSLFLMMISLLTFNLQPLLVSEAYAYTGTEEHTYIPKKASAYPEIIDVKEKPYQQIDINKLPDNQLLKVEDKVLSVGQAKQKIKQSEVKMAEAEKHLIAETKSQSIQAINSFNEQKTVRHQSLVEKAMAVAKPAARSVLQAQLAPVSQKYTTTYQKGKQYHAYKPEASQPKPTYPQDTTPVITKLNVNSGQPGDPIVIDGRDFGQTNPYSAVEFYTAHDKKSTLNIEYWSDTQIVGIVPSVPVVQSYEGLLWVTKPGRQSKRMTFRYDPEMEIKFLPIGKGNFDSGGFGCRKGPIYYETGGESVYVRKCPQFFIGKSGDDQFFYKNELLRNNWEVVRGGVIFTKTVSEPGEADASISEKHEGTNRPYVKVHFWVTPFDQVVYRLSIQIRGPKGMPYF